MAQRLATRLCKHCGGDGYNDLYPENVCACCHGSGEVPAEWWWDDDGSLHTEPKEGDGSMGDKQRFATYTTALVTTDTGEVVSEVAGWTDAITGEPVTDPAWLQRLERSMPKTKVTYTPKQAVEMLENDDETWSPARFYRDQGNGIVLVRKADTGQVIGVPVDRLRAAQGD